LIPSIVTGLKFQLIPFIIGLGIGQLAYGQRVDSHYLYNVYGPPYLYFIKTFQAKEEEAAKQQAAASARSEAMERWQPSSLLGKYRNIMRRP
jgi:hypothetical protein